MGCIQAFPTMARTTSFSRTFSSVLHTPTSGTLNGCAPSKDAASTLEVDSSHHVGDPPSIGAETFCNQSRNAGRSCTSLTTGYALTSSPASASRDCMMPPKCMMREKLLAALVHQPHRTKRLRKHILLSQDRPSALLASTTPYAPIISLSTRRCCGRRRVQRTSQGSVRTLGRFPSSFFRSCPFHG